MGEMADLLIDSMFDEDEHGLCGMDNLMYFEESNSFIGPGRIKKGVTCRCCGTNNLFWYKEENGKWRLHERYNLRLKLGGLHYCPVNPLRETFHPSKVDVGEEKK